MHSYLIYSAVILLMCHVVGYYLFQPKILDIKNPYNSFVKALLYGVSFGFAMGFMWQTYVMIGVYLIFNNLYRYNKISFALEQSTYYVAILVYYVTYIVKGALLS